MTLYLDTSSLVKLYVAEPESESVRRLVENADIAVSGSEAHANRSLNGVGPPAGQGH